MKAQRFFLAITLVLALLASLSGLTQVALARSSITLATTSTSSITAHKFHDANRNQVRDEGEEDIEGWLIRLYRWDDTGLYMVAEGSTGKDGTVTFSDLVPTRYKVWEKKSECWEPTTPAGMTQWDGGYYTVVKLGEGQQAAVEFGNVNTCDQPPEPPPSPPDPETCIDLEKTGPRTAEPGATITYHFWVKNCGDVTLAGGAQVYDPLFGDDPIWNGELQPGQVHEFDKSHTLPDDHCGDFTNNAWAIGHPLGPEGYLPEVRDDDSWTVMVICCDDADGDGVCDDDDNCPVVYNPDQADADHDGVGDACDGCPSDPNKVAPGVCGCGTPDTDSDGDGTADCNDNCPADPNKTEPGACGCGVADTDSDGDGTPDCDDLCPNDPDKTEPGVCGCGAPDTDSDGDGTADCEDNCPADPDKTEPGVCGCGVVDTDTDNDGTPDCNDLCPNDPNKVAPGVCGCGTPDTDSDGDGVPNCNDNCPDTPNPDQTDSNGDGTGDACEEACIELTKTINGPYRTSDDLFLTDRVIPVAVIRDFCSYLPDNTENLFYFRVDITVENCGGTELTGVVVQDTFSNEAQPFAPNGPGTVTISPSPDPNNGMVHESLTWSVGTIPVGESRALQVKVGTEFNPSGRLEPTSAPQTIFYNGRNNDTGSASVTADGGLSASVGAMAISNGNEISCRNRDGNWYNLLYRSCWHHHDRCTQITTPLPITLTDSDGSELTTSSTTSPLQNAAPVAAAGAATTTALAGAAWVLGRRKLL
jgi:hypothetical protein